MEDDQSEEDFNVINVRQSIYHIKNKLDRSVERDLEIIDEDREWNLRHLRGLFQTDELKKLFIMYNLRLNQAFFALLMLIQAGLFAVHFVVIFIVTPDMSTNLLDLIVYALMTCISIKMFFVTDGCGYITLSERTLRIIAIVFFILLNLVNAAVPVYYFLSKDVQLRPAYTKHITISCYVFFFISNIGMTVCLGLLTLILHIALLVCVTYHGVPHNELTGRILSDCIFLLCINGLGVYYRYLNEIIKRKSFLDRRGCVISNKHLQFQKEEAEQLMDTLIPSYVVSNVRENILRYWEGLDNIKSNTVQLEYKSSFTQTFEDVTILFADVVNYTEMTVKLKINQLLETLNELFGNFDNASDRLGVLRIKFLGDCYYCVSGLPPTPPENPAEACVDLGLEMIKIIAGVRRRRNINIDMRIGVHTGKIISGIIGYQKNQFDIWSRDVSLANQMETEGQAGKVHLTHQTKKLLRKKYNMQMTNKGQTVPIFKKLELRTYLVSPENPNTSLDKKTDISNIYMKKRSANVANNKRSSNSKTEAKSMKISNGTIETFPESEETVKGKRVQYYHLIETGYNEEENTPTEAKNPSPRRTPDRQTSILSDKSDPRDSQRRTAFMSNNLRRYKEIMNESYEEMRKAIDNLCLTKYQQWFEFKEINPIFLTFPEKKHELRFMSLHDPLFKYYLISEVALLVFLFVIQNLTLTEWNWKSYWIYGTFVVLVFVFIPVMWSYYFFRDSSNRILRKIGSLSKSVSQSVWARLAIYTTVCILFTLCVFSEVIECRYRFDDHEKQEKAHRKLRSFLGMISEEHDDYGVCIVPWHMTQTCGLAIIMSFLFLRMYIWVKFIYAFLITIAYSCCICYYSEDILQGNQETYNYQMSTKISHVLSVVFLTFTLHIIDRQTEYMNRLDFLWNKDLKKEQLKIQSRYIINKMLLNNVLPEHLTEKYLNLERPPGCLYHEWYTNAAVIFASVVGYDYEVFEDEQLLTIMGEIIGDFDKLNIMNDYGHHIEKIKVAKWTYMAACGVSPGYGEVNQCDPSTQVETLLKFAAAMIKTLNEVDRKKKHGFKLRIGISNGEIVAGVVGSKKPLYDIWGDPVNMAARMDTTGEANKIHVLERTATIVKDMGYKCTLRGNTLVKGLKNPVPTYFVDLDENYELIRM